MQKFLYVKAPALSETYYADLRLPDTTKDYDSLKRQFRKWTDLEKAVLIFLSSKYNKSHQEAYQAFNILLDNLEGKCTRPTFRAWRAMRSMNLTLSQSQRDLLPIVHIVACRIGIPFALKSECRLLRNRTRKCGQRSIRESTSPEAWRSSPSPPGEVIVTPRQHRNTGLEKAGGFLTPPSSQRAQDRSYRTCPPILFRAFSRSSAGVNSAHGFIASRFICQSPIPNVVSRLEYLQDLENHLEPIPSDTSPLTACSPFVSTTQSLLRALHICLRSAQANAESYIAVIDTTALHSIDAVQDNDAGPNARKAFGEFVCWAMIPGEAILCVFPTQRLLEFSLTQRIDQSFNFRIIGTFRSTNTARRAVSAGKQPLNYHFGRAVGSLLSFLTIPMVTIEYMTSSILTDFFLQKDEVWRQNLEFLRGRNEALCINPFSAEDDQLIMDRFISDLCRYAGQYANPLLSTSVGTTGQLAPTQRFVRVEIAKSAEN